MHILKYLFVLISCYRCTGEENNTAAEVIWKLSKYALESRQNYKKYPSVDSNRYPSYYEDISSPISYYGTKYPYSQYYHQNDGAVSNKIYPGYEYPYKQHFQKYQKKNSFMDILASIARNDDLECVPKILCEVTSGTMSGRQQGINLPVNLNMESLLGFLTVLSSVRPSPVLHFGKAALLGVSSKGNAASCNTAYPKCPSDPEKLVYYLNNHNGGFFKYFNGKNIRKDQPYKYSKKYPQQYRPSYQNYLAPSNIKDYYPEYYDKKPKAEQRIQTNPVNSAFESNGLSDYATNVFKFPIDENTPSYNYHRNPKGLVFTDDFYHATINQDLFNKVPGVFVFPNNENSGSYSTGFSVGQPEELSNYDRPNDQLVFPKPLREHTASPMIFPTRTGTGQLLLDADELDDYRGTVAFDETFIDQGSRYQTNANTLSSTYNRGGRGLVFPS